jgi:hypothetical protein
LFVGSQYHVAVVDLTFDISNLASAAKATGARMLDRVALLMQDV